MTARIVFLNGDTTLKFFAVDIAGNEEAIQTETYTLDQVGPAAVDALRVLVQENYGERTLNISPDSIYTGAIGASLFARRGVDDAVEDRLLQFTHLVQLFHLDRDEGFLLACEHFEEVDVEVVAKPGMDCRIGRQSAFSH